MAQSPQMNFDAMRQDAVRRSREMQRRAMPPPPEVSSPIPPTPPPPAPITPPRPPERPDLLKNLHFSDDLQKLLTGWDGEKLALLGLLYLLYKEGAELELLLAIAYIML